MGMSTDFVPAQSLFLSRTFSSIFYACTNYGNSNPWNEDIDDDGELTSSASSQPPVTMGKAGNRFYISEVFSQRRNGCFFLIRVTANSVAIMKSGRIRNGENSGIT